MTREWEEDPREREARRRARNRRVIAGVAALLLVAAGLWGVVVHAWTVVLAWHTGGPLAGAASFAFPVFAEIVLAVVVSVREGAVGNDYVLALAACLGAWVAGAVLAALVDGP